MPDRDERIAARAYEIWEAAGRPEGLDVDHWLTAEAEIGNRLAPTALGDSSEHSSAGSPADVADEENRNPEGETLGASGAADRTPHGATAPATNQKKKGSRG